jgi:hypothetical protein
MFLYSTMSAVAFFGALEICSGLQQLHIELLFHAQGF